MKILHVVGRLDVGGIEKYLLDFIPAAASRGIGGDIVTLFERKPGSLAPRFKELGCQVFAAHALRRRSALRATLTQAFEASEPNVVHSHLGEMSGDAARLLAGKGAKLAVQAHDLGKLARAYLEPYRRLSRSWTLKYADVFLAVSQLAAERLMGASRTGARVVPVGLDLQAWKFKQAARDKVRGELGIDADAKLILHVGRFQRVKNHSFMLHIAAELRSRRLAFKMVFAGDGATLATTQEAAHKMMLDDGVVFLGQRNDVRALMSAADVFILPSRSEGTPRVLLEATATGLPFIATSNADLSGLFPSGYQLEIESATTWATRIVAELAKGRAPAAPLVDLSIERAVEQTLAAYDSPSHCPSKAD